MLIVAGGQEVLIDGIVKFEEKFRKGFGEEKVEFFVDEDGYHDQPSLDIQLGYQEKNEGEQAKKVKSWIASKL